MRGWGSDWIKGLLQLGVCGGGINLLLRCGRPRPSAGRCEVRAGRGTRGLGDQHDEPYSNHKEQDTEE
jgi:hypothetical protein